MDRRKRGGRTGAGGRSVGILAARGWTVGRAVWIFLLLLLAAFTGSAALGAGSGGTAALAFLFLLGAIAVATSARAKAFFATYPARTSPVADFHIDDLKVDEDSAGLDESELNSMEDLERSMRRAKQAPSEPDEASPRTLQVGAATGGDVRDAVTTAESAPADAAESASAEAKPAESAPADAAESISAEAKPAESAPADAAESASAEARPVESAPTDAAETVPAESAPADAAESDSAETNPADTAAPAAGRVSAAADTPPVIVVPAQREDSPVDDPKRLEEQNSAPSAPVDEIEQPDASGTADATVPGSTHVGAPVTPRVDDEPVIETGDESTDPPETSTQLKLLASESAGSDLLSAYTEETTLPPEAVRDVAATLIVSDLAASVMFYTELLGLVEIDRARDAVLLEAGFGRVLLWRREDAPPSGGPAMHLTFEVGDIDSAYGTLSARGVKFTHPPRSALSGEVHDLRAASFHDPDGHGLAITELKQRSEPAVGQ